MWKEGLDLDCVLCQAATNSEPSCGVQEKDAGEKKNPQGPWPKETQRKTQVAAVYDNLLHLF